MKVELTGERLKDAVIVADLYELSLLPPDDKIEHTFSTRFSRKMKTLIRQSKNRSLTAQSTFKPRKLIAILVAALILLFSSAMSVSAVRETVFKFITEVYEKYTQVFLKETQPSQPIDEVFMAYAPAKIPAGFELVHENLDGLVMLEYERENQYLTYEQKRLDKVSMHINTEGIKLEELEFNGLPAKYYSNQGMQTLIWYDDNYMYMISSTLSKDAVFDIAKSIKAYRR